MDPQSSSLRPGAEPPPPSDADLARRIASSGTATDGRAAFEEAELCRRFERRLVYFGLRRLGSEDAARDLAQDTLLLTLQKLRAGEVRELESIGSFILGVARTLAARQGDRDRDHCSLEELPREPGVAAAPAPDPLALDRVADCMEGLPDRQRSIVLLSFYAEQSSIEIANSLGLTRGNVRVLRHRGVARLRDCLDVGGRLEGTA